ncbi:MAG: DUF349 domain-containing protein, partial [Lentisphaerae bacterium]
ESLLAEAEALVASEKNDRQTTERLKAIQQEWKEIGMAPRREERELWNRLRSVCDKYFNRRHRVWEDRQEKMLENLRAKQEILAALERLVQQRAHGQDHSSARQDEGGEVAPDLASQLKAAFEQNFAASASSFNERDEIRYLQQRWQEIGHVPRNEFPALQARYRELLDLYYGRRRKKARGSRRSEEPSEPSAQEDAANSASSPEDTGES